MRFDKVCTQRGHTHRQDNVESRLLPSIADLFVGAEESDAGLKSKSILLPRLNSASRPNPTGIAKSKVDGLHTTGIANSAVDALHTKRSRESCALLCHTEDGSDTGYENNRLPSLVPYNQAEGNDCANPAASSPLPSSPDEEAEDLRAARAAFSKLIFTRQPTTPRGFVCCLLCRKDCWAPNGRYHVDTCTAVLDARQAGQGFVGDMNIPMPPEAAFSRPAKPSRRPGKIPGFVVADAAPGKGYVECLVCSRLVWAPNSGRHRIQCKMNFEAARVAQRNDARTNGNKTNSERTPPSTDPRSGLTAIDLLCYESLSE